MPVGRWTWSAAFLYNSLVDRMAVFTNVLEKARNSGDLTREEIIALLSLDDADDIARLVQAADEVRRECVGDDVHIRGLIEFSNNCAQNCLYCGLRRDNPDVHRYRMTGEEIVETAVGIAGKKIGTIVLQSGEDPWFTAERMAGIIHGIKSRADCAITLSIGERPYEDYRLMKEAGADRYLLRHETASPELYGRLHPDSQFESRRQCLIDLRELCYQVGAGCMVGLPGQTIEDLANDVEFLRRLDPDMIGIGPFIAHPNTPLAESPGGDLTLTLKMIAVVRLVTRNALMPATTAVGTIDEFGIEKALTAGANVVMPNYTPLEYRVYYEIYPNKRCITEDPESCIGRMSAQILSIGRTVAEGPGHSYKRNG